MCNHKGQLIVRKGFFGFRKFYKEFRKYERLLPDSDFILHFRIATSGQLNYANTHPFHVTENIAFAHNGILFGLGNARFSDTYMFNEDILKRLPDGFLDNKEVRSALEEYIIASGSKLAFMTNTGRVVIVNSKAGTWDNGIWYSHNMYLFCYPYEGYSSCNSYGFGDYSRRNYTSRTHKVYGGEEYDNEGHLIYTRDKIRGTTFLANEDYYCQKCHSWFEKKDLFDDYNGLYCPLCGELLEMVL